MTITYAPEDFGPTGLRITFQTSFVDSTAVNVWFPYTILGAIPASKTYQLSPIVSNIADISGTGTAAGDTITIQTTDGTVLGTTEVADDGTWSFDPAALGISAATNYTIIESNDLGDIAGGYNVEHKTISRTINYVNATDQPSLGQPVIQEIALTRTGSFSVDDPSAITWNEWSADGNETEFEALANPTQVNLMTMVPTVPSASFDQTAPDDLPDVTVFYYPTTYTIQPDAPVSEDDPIDASQPEGPKAPAGLNHDDLNKEVTLDYRFIDAETNNPVVNDVTMTPVEGITRTLAFTRTAQVTYVDGTPTTTYSPWTAVTTATFDALTPPAVNGYFPHVTETPTRAVALEGQTLTSPESVVIKYYRDQITVLPLDPKNAGDAVVRGDVDSPQYPTGVAAGDLNQSVTRTILYVDATDKNKAVASPETLTLNFSRSATITFDPITKRGTPSYNPWMAETTDTFAAVTNPAVAGMFTLDTDVSEATVTAEDEDLPPIIIRYYSTTYTVTPDQPLTEGEPVIPGDENGPQAPAGLTASDLNQTVSRTITYVDGTDPSKSVASPQTQTLAFSRSATITYDPVTKIGTVVYGEWTAATTDTFAAVTNPAVTGMFTLDNDVPEATVAAEDEDLPPITIRYYSTTFTVTPDQPLTENDPVISGDVNGPKAPAGLTAGDLNQTVSRTIAYVDGTDANKIVAPPKTQTLAFTRSATIVYDPITKVGTVVYGDWTATTTDTFDVIANPAVAGMFTLAEDVPEATVAAEDEDLPPITIRYYSTTYTVTPDQPLTEGEPVIPGDENGPQAPAGLTASDLNQTVSRTIAYVDGTDPSKSVASPQTQTLAFTRSATITYDPVTKIGTVVHGDWTATTTDTFTAVTNPTVADMFTRDNDVPEATVAAEDEDLPPITIRYYSTTYTVTPDQPLTEGDPVIPGDENSPQAPAGLTASDLNQTVSRTIAYVDGTDPSKSVASPQTQTLAFTRSATITYDPVTKAGTVVYGNWTATTTDTFATVTNPKVADMFTRDNDVPEATVAAEDEDLPPITVHYYSTTYTVTPDQPLTENDPVIPGDVNGPKAPAGLTADDLNQTVTRTINYVDAADPAITVATAHTETLTFTRQAIITYDAAGNGTVQYAEWQPTTSDTFTAVANPPIENKFALNSEVVAVSVTATAADLDEVVKYYATTYEITPEAPVAPGTSVIDGDEDGPKAPAGLLADDLNQTVTRTIAYVAAADATQAVAAAKSEALHFSRKATLTYDPVTKAGTVVYGDWVAETTDTFATVVNPVVPDMFTLAPDVPATSVSAEASDIPSIIHYYSTTYTVTPDQPLTEGDSIIPGDEDGPKAPAGLLADDLNQTVTRTISYVDATDPTKAVAATQTQTLRFSRSATISYDAAGVGTVRYSDWAPETTAIFAAIPHPAVSAMFTLDPPVNAVTVAEDTADLTVIVHYYGTTYTITPDKPVEGGTPILTGDTNSPKAPDGLTATDLNQTVTRTITYVDAADSTVTVAPPHTETLTFTRAATVTYDATGTGRVQYGDWQPQTTATFATVTTPIIADKFALEAATAEATVTATDEDLTTIVKYYATTYAVTPDQPFTPGQPLIPDDPEGPKAPSGVTTVDLNQSVTRTIQYVDADNPSQAVAAPVVETRRFTRQATIAFNAAGQAVVTYGDWVASTTNTFDAVTHPTVPARFTLAPAVAATTIEAESPDLTIVVHYYPSRITVSPDAPQDAGTSVNPADPDSPRYPAGVDTATLIRVITRTIAYLEAATGRALRPTTTQTITFTRSATIDYPASGEPVVTYSPWAAVTPTFDAVPAPAIDGFIATSPGIPSQTIDAEAADQVATLTYAATPAGDPEVKQPTSPANDQSTSDKPTTQRALPQTGERSTVGIVGLGWLLLLSSLSLFGLVGRRRKKQ
ncbi:mucin-binding protein [Lacticaseibacillus daqingensis]|uniref:mucin-binding protein n=1 Tax=Lacticaseibacillus daqingensis TaxID=2486014 RepID=UPI001CDD2307|nr:LPXTG cell wall anchor domain-containing protein [Lacticaseibacillus daqingensis]